ncbi:hypothetical protein D3C72_1694430 [compost metagenome]
MASNAPPATAAMPAHSGAAGKNTTAQGHCASQYNRAVKGCKLSAARLHSGAHNTPANASGVTTSVTHGIATRLAANPTTETCPNNNRLNGESASVTTHCSRNNA